MNMETNEASPNNMNIMQEMLNELEDNMELQLVHQIAIGEQKVKYSQLESEYKQLQKKLLEQQIQYETLSGQYKDEQRRHSETNNMAQRNEKICDEVMADLRRRVRELEREASRINKDHIEENGDRLHFSKYIVDKRDEYIEYLQGQKKQMIDNFNTQMLDSKNIITQMEISLKNNTEEIDSLKRALTKQEEFSKSVCDDLDALQKQLAAAQELTRTAASKAVAAANLENQPKNLNKTENEFVKKQFEVSKVLASTPMNQIFENSFEFASSTDSLGPQEGDSNFTAHRRGEPLPLASLASLKKRHASSAQQQRASSRQSGSRPKSTGEVETLPLASRKRRRACSQQPQDAPVPASTPKPSGNSPPPNESNIKTYKFFKSKQNK